VSSQARREQVAFACESGLSERRACELLEVARSALTYRSVRAERDAPSLEAMRRLAAHLGPDVLPRTLIPTSIDEVPIPGARNRRAPSGARGPQPSHE